MNVRDIGSSITIHIIMVITTTLEAEATEGILYINMLLTARLYEVLKRVVMLSEKSAKQSRWLYVNKIRLAVDIYGGGTRLTNWIYLYSLINRKSLCINTQSTDTTSKHMNHSKKLLLLYVAEKKVR